MSAAMKRIWIQLTADRKRFGVLCATVGVGLLLWARLIIVSGVSRTAMAEDGRKPGAEGLAGGAAGAASGGSAASGGEADKRSEKGGTVARETVEVRLWSRSERDPFVISPEHFPRAKSEKEVKGDAGKLPTEPAEDAGQKEARLVARLREVLGTLRLEAAMGNTMAIIDGKRYVVGESLPLMGKERVEFKLQEVRQRSVVLEAEGRRFEVEMSVPGATSAAPRSGN
jgi:hypothetical protein